jgi:hypothetical protein
MPGSAAISDPRPPAAALGSSRERAPSGHPQTRSPQALRLHRVDPAPGLALAAVTLATLRPLALAEQFLHAGADCRKVIPRRGSAQGGLPTFVEALANGEVAPFPAIRESILGCAASRVPQRYNALCGARPDHRILSWTLGDGRQ